ncbi:MAG: carbohydrate ABC transporter permease [Thermomicrobiales bacterium]
MSAAVSQNLTPSIVEAPPAGSSGAARIVRQTLLWIGAIAALLFAGTPFVFMIVTAFKSQGEFLSNMWGLPQQFNIDNFRQVLEGGFARYLLNTALVSAGSVALTLLAAALAAYPLARSRFRLQRPIFLLFLAGAMIPVHVTLIPTFILSRDLGLYDTRWALLGPYIGFNLPLAIFILTEFMRQVPRELEEAALVDGASSWERFSRIMLPLCVPAMSTVGIYAFIFVWNEFIFALVLLSSPEKMTMPLGLMQFYGQYQINVPGIMAALTLGSLPVIALYLVAQERVVAGLVAGALKG